MIEAKNLSKSFPGVQAVDDASFEIAPGRVVGFLGPNGAGKSTTLRMLSGFLPPSSGSARVAGFDVARESLAVRRSIGYLPETNPLYSDMRVREYLNYRAQLKGLDRPDRRRRTAEVILRVGLSEFADRIVGQLSKGMRQRVGLADALVHDPPVLLLDEPMIGLDPNQIREMRQVILELGEKKTVLLSSHILSEVELTCGRVIILVKGRIAAQGTTEEIARKLGTTGRVRLEILGDGAPIKAALDKMPGVHRVLWNQRGNLHIFVIDTAGGADIRQDLYELAKTRGWKAQEIGFERMALEEAFSRLTEKAAP